MSKTKLVTGNTTQEELQIMAEQAAGELPPPGHARQEALKSRQDELEVRAEQMAAQMLLNTIDPSTLEIAREIAAKVQFLDVSNKQPGFVYQWVSTNRNGEHVMMAKQLGFVTVQGDDPEAIELKGEGSLDTTRRLADTILMKIPEERWIVLKALEIKRQREVEGASSSMLVSLGDRYRDRGILVKPYGMETLEGPRVRPGRFSTNQARAWLQQARFEKGM